MNITIDENIVNVSLIIEDNNPDISLVITEEITAISIEVQDVAIPGQQGVQGLSNYEIAVNNGFIGTEAQWLASLVVSNIDGGLIY